MQICQPFKYILFLQRKDTLIRELHHSKKSNFLLDKRFGEGDSSLTADEKMVQRFALEKKVGVIMLTKNLKKCLIKNFSCI